MRNSNISIPKSDPDLESPTFFSTQSPLNFSIVSKNLLPREISAKNHSHRIAQHSPAEFLEKFRSLGGRDPACRSENGSSMIHLRCLVHGTCDRIVSPPPPPRVVTLDYLFSPLRNRNESSSWLSAKCRAKRDDKASSFSSVSSSLHHLLIH